MNSERYMKLRDARRLQRSDARTEREKIFIDLMTSDHNFMASREGSK